MQNKFSNHRIFIMPNYPDNTGFKWNAQPFDKNFICIGFYEDRNEDDVRVAVNLEQAKFIVESLKEIITFTEECIQEQRDINLFDEVRITNGILKGFIGEVQHLALTNKSKPLTIKIENGDLICDVKLNYNDVEKVFRK